LDIEKDEGTRIFIKNEITIDEKHRSHRYYKYYIKFENKMGLIMYLVFFDEDRNLEDKDYHDFATEEDKSDKISGFHIYYDSEVISTKELEENVCLLF